MKRKVFLPPPYKEKKEEIEEIRFPGFPHRNSHSNHFVMQLQAPGKSSRKVTTSIDKKYCIVVFRKSAFDNMYSAEEHLRRQLATANKEISNLNEKHTRLLKAIDKLRS